MNIIRPVSLTALLFAFAGPAAAQTAYSFDAAGNTVEINVYREGFFKAFGHDHLVAAKDFSGTVSFDANKIENSSVALRVKSNSLTAVDPGESEKDRNDVQTTMLGEKVLDVARFPEIVYVSTGVARAERKGDAWSVMLSGKLQLHGVEKPVALPVKVRVSEEGLTAEGQVFLLQTEYGITPVKVAGGTVKVKDRLRIHFVIHARVVAP